MKHGPGWIIYEDSYPFSTHNLLSILSPRRTPNQAASFIEQIYIDRYTSILERVAYKKSARSAIYSATIDPTSCIIHCGDNPFLVGVYAQSIALVGKSIEFTYKIADDISDPLNVKFADRHQSLLVDF